MTAAMLLTGCSASGPVSRTEERSANSSTPAPGSSSRTLAAGTFTPTHGVSGDVSIESSAGTLSLTLTSFQSGGVQTRLLLVDADAESLGSCAPDTAKSASVGGTPAGPKSSFPFASESELGSAVPRFRSVVLVRQHGDGDGECTEPIVAIAPLQWSGS